MKAADHDDRPDELTERYRTAAAADPTRPSDAVRESILARARAVASDRAPPPRALPKIKSAASSLRWPISAAASVMVATLAAVLAWHVSKEPERIDRPTTAPPPAADADTRAPSQRTFTTAAPATPPSPAPEMHGERDGAASRQEPSAPAANAADTDASSLNLEQRSLRALRAAGSPPASVPYLQTPRAEHLAGMATAKEAAHYIDWAAVGPGDPIPASMPTASSDDPLAAGFSPEWARRALKGRDALAASRPLQRQGGRAPAEAMALTIVSRRRAAEDLWAQQVERRLREVIRRKVEVQGPTVVRVFCNAVGCLCYTERDDAAASGAASAAVLDALTSGTGWAQELGIDPAMVYVLPAGTAPGPVWQLVFIMRTVPAQN
ncbi:MAG: hypothetical protein JO299_04640 [Gammaproteobacteria bacterium]|nr:hypothetical protein [Gammaproteobacteria bacterium]